MNTITKHRRLSFFLLFLYAFLPAFGHSNDTISIMEWNVENLFDCRHDTLKNDNEFLPDGLRHWNYYRYRHKLDLIAKTIVASTGNWTPPALIALCEVENDSVLIALTRYSALRELGYRYVVTDCMDQRGIDVALLYQRDRFKLLDYEYIRVSPLKDFRPTRDILHATGLITLQDTLDIYVVHAPSRSGGEKLSRPYRIHFSKTLMTEIEKLKCKRRTPKILILGDFNDLPGSPAINKILAARASEGVIDDNNLYHLLARQVKQNKEGSYKYKGEWNLLDHFIVSGSLLHTDNKIYTSESLAQIVHLPFLMTDDKTYGGKRPYRTYYGMKYENGYSDHLPLLMQMIITAE